MPERRQAVVPFHTTTGNQLRALTFEIIQRQLKSVGIELVPASRRVAPFGTTLPSRDWDLMLFAWVGSPSSSITVKDILGCGGDQNDGAYCNQACRGRPEPGLDHPRRREAGELLNAAELKYVAKDIPSIPMFARPLYTINANKVKGVGVNPTQEGAPGTSPTGRLEHRSQLLSLRQFPETIWGAGLGQAEAEPMQEDATPVLTYIIRRLLYSAVVLVLSFPRLHLRDRLRRPARRPADRTERLRADGAERDRPQAPRRPDAEALPLLVQDAVTNQFGSTLLDNRPILPELWRVMKNTLQLVLMAQILIVPSPS